MNQENKRVYYNDNDPHINRWAKNLVDAGLVPNGDIDERSILDVRPVDLDGYTQCHFFSGIFGWPYALELAGWDPARPVWTASLPCQPFSSAGKRQGEADDRHLWPVFRELVAECRPPTIFGEQVSSKAGREWLAGVRADLEALGYAVGAADLCAASAGEEAQGWFVRGDQLLEETVIVGAPHIRQRLFWVAVAQRPGVRGSGPGETGRTSSRVQGTNGERERLRPDAGPGSPLVAGRLSNAREQRCDRGPRLEGGGRHETERCEACRHAVGEQSQSSNIERRGLQAEGSKSLDSVPLDRSEISLAGLIRDEGGSCCCTDRSTETGGPVNTSDGANSTPCRMANASGTEWRCGSESEWECRSLLHAPDGCATDRIPHTQRDGLQGGVDTLSRQGTPGRGLRSPDMRGLPCRLELIESDRRLEWWPESVGRGVAARCEPGLWSTFDLIPCRDGKTRRVESGLECLVDGISFRLPDGRTVERASRAALLKGFGNAIVPPLAAEFVKAFLEVEAEIAA